MTPEATPRYIELEDFRRSVNRKIWFMVAGLLLVSLFALGLVLITLIRPIPVIVLNQEGQPVLFQDTASPRDTMTDVRVRYFIKMFLEKFEGIDSARVQDDLAESLNMMTPRLRKVMLADEQAIERRRRRAEFGSDTKSKLTTAEIRIGAYDDKNPDQEIYAVVTGVISFTHRSGLEEGGSIDKHYYSEVRLRRVPVTESTIHGLLVDSVNTTLFSTKDRLEAHILEHKN